MCARPHIAWWRVGALVATVVAGLIVAAPGMAKFPISAAASNTTPVVGERVTVVIRSERLPYNLRLLAVAPDRNVFRVATTLTGDTRNPVSDVGSKGFEVPLVRAAPGRWRAIMRFPSSGRWRLIVPNFAPVGVVYPAGVERLSITVHQ